MAVPREVPPTSSVLLAPVALHLWFGVLWKLMRFIVLHVCANLPRCRRWPTTSTTTCSIRHHVRWPHKATCPVLKIRARLGGMSLSLKTCLALARPGSSRPGYIRQAAWLSQLGLMGCFVRGLVSASACLCADNPETTRSPHRKDGIQAKSACLFLHRWARFQQSRTTSC